MSERNPEIPFTYNYSQPEEYHFSIDSIEAAWEISLYLKNLIDEDRKVKKTQLSDYLSHQVRNWKALDLCAGCGVIGFEVNYHLPSVRQIDFVEVQKEYRNHFEKNKSMVQNEGQFQFFETNYERFLDDQFKENYHLIFSNPPYFQPGQGKHSPSEFKNRCRFFIDSSFKKLIEVYIHCLHPVGEAFLLLRDLDDHDIDLLGELRSLVKGKLAVENLSMIRGTFLLKLSKKMNEE